jgi:uncharacterized C2H2 Zn-finger protein
MTDAKTLNVLEQYLEKIASESSARHLFPQRPVLPFGPALSRCKKCHAVLKVGKTRTKTVTTCHLGSFTAHETFLQCPRCHTIHGSEELSRLAPSGCTFGYDVMIFAGKALFLRHRTAEETVEELRQGNVRISASEVAYLAKKFVVYLALAHRQCAPRLNALLRGNGGYILHLDGTCEGGGPMLMSSLDSLSQIVLGNRKMPSEKAAEIIPLLQQIKQRHGSPAGIVHDMGTGIRTAVDQVFPGIPDFICHFHFLRDLGKDLLAADYDSIRARLRKHALAANLQTHARRLQPVIDREPGAIDVFCKSVHDGAEKNTPRPLLRLCTYSLVQWVLEGKKQGDGLGFPFDRPHLHFAKRALAASTLLDSLNVQGAWQDTRPLFQLSWALRKLREDSVLQKAIATLEAKIEVFDQLRGAMRIAETGGSSGLNSGNDPLPIGPIKQAVLAFRENIVSRPDYSCTQHWKSLIAQIDKYSEKLFADPIELHTPNGSLLVQPQRTNNILERFFRDFRRGWRRRTGRNSIGTFLQTMIADTPIVKNLANPLYLKALLNGQPSLERRFDQIDAQLVRTEMLAAQHPLEKVPGKIHRLIATQDFPEIIASLLKKVA